MKLTSENLIQAEKILFEIEGLIINGEREGWGYSLNGMAQTIAILANETKMAKEREK